eukprot:scaffold157172_cov33-Cyclotella_meneghiniana.AAC.1
MLNRWGSGFYNRMDDDKIIKDAPKKSGFKGKRPKAKFSKNARKGADVKGGHTYKDYRDELKRQRAAAGAAAGAPAAASPTQRAIASVTSRAALSSPTKKELKSVLLKTSRDLRSMATERDVAVAKSDRLKKKLVAKKLTVVKAKQETAKYKAASRKSMKGQARVERALNCERALRHEDAIAAQAALERERKEFQLHLKAAINEVKREERQRSVVLRDKLQDQMEEQLRAVKKYYLDEINIINSRHDARITKLDGQMVVSCLAFLFNTKLFFSNYIIHQLRICISKSQVPDFAPVNLPELPDDFSLGIRSAVRKELDDKRELLKVDVRRRAKLEMERLEESGVTDGVEYMQEASWPVDRLLEDSEFKIQVCWMFQVDDGDGFASEELKWCSGVVTSLVRDKSDKYNFVDVMIEWNNEWVQVEDERVTIQRLKRKDFNPSKPFQ